MMEAIKISNELLKEFEKRKIDSEDTYEGVIWGLVENDMELSEQTLKNIKESEKDIKEGRTIPYEKVKKIPNLNS